MSRRCAGTLTPALASNSTASPNRMRPRSGASSPAIMLTIEVLPEPEAPNSAVAPPAVSNAAAIEKSPRRFWTSTASILFPVKARSGAAREPFRDDQRRERDGDCDQDQPAGRGVPAGNVGIGVDGGGDGLRLARNVGGGGAGGAELPQRLGEAQDHACNHAGQCKRQRDGREHPAAARAQRRGGVLEPAVDRLDREPDRA